MQKSSLRALIAVLVLLPALAWAQAAGRVLMAVGDVSVQRGTATIPLAANAFIFPGDTIRLGVDSNAQIRFSDESIVGLRAGSVFRVDEYQFSQGSGKGIFSLLAGGMRTVTGQIGRLVQDRRNYAVRTPTSTIGIRGTHYTVVHCNNDCGNAKTASALLAAASMDTASDAGPLAQAGGGGSSVPNGTYGGVTDGRISAAPNDAPELGREFGHDEYFYVATPNSAPESLLAPPAFLHDRLSGQRRSSGQQGEESGETLAQGGINAESRPGSVPEGPQPSTFVVTEQRTATGESAVVGTVTPTHGGLAGWISNDGAAGAGGAFFVLGETANASYIVADSNNLPTRIRAIAGCTGPNDGCESGLTATLGAPAAGTTGAGSSVAIYWGRWDSGTIDEGEGVIDLANPYRGGAHFLYGPLTPPEVIASKTGSFTFLDAAGTTPTNNLGQVAISSNFPEVQVNFTSRTANTVNGMSWSFTGPNPQSWNVPGGQPLKFTIVTGQGAHLYGMVNSVATCSGSGCGAANGFFEFSGIFMGPKGDHMGTSIAVGTTTSPSGAQAVRVYNCSAC